MAPKTRLFNSKEHKNRADIAAFLRDLADRVEEGTVTLQQGEETVTLNLPDIVRLEVDASRKDKKRGPKFDFEVELEWVEGDTGDTGVTLA